MTSGSPTSAMAPGSQLTPLAKGQEQEGGEKKVSCSASASTELLMPLDNDPGTRRKKKTSMMVTGKRRVKAFTRRSASLAPFKQQREAHNSTTFHTKSATVVKSISHYL